MKHLSPDEQKVLRMAIRHRAEYLQRMKRMRAITRGAKRGLLIAAGAIGLLAGTANVQAASAPALFNEANAAQRAGQYGSAILGYERARLLAPRDSAIVQNLQSAREKAGVAASAFPAWQRPAHMLSLDGLAVLASISLLLLSLLVFGTRLIPTTLRGLARGVATTFGVTALLATSAVAARWPELDRAVIQSARAIARIAPAAAAESAFELKAGEIVQAEKTYGDFVFVRTPDARAGWVGKADIETIIPSGAQMPAQ